MANIRPKWPESDQIIFKKLMIKVKLDLIGQNKPNKLNIDHIGQNKQIKVKIDYSVQYKTIRKKLTI